MKTILIEDLDPRTSEWLREASRHEQVVVTDHGTPIMTIKPVPSVARPAGGFRNRVLLPEFEAMMNRPIGGTDSTDILSQDREDRL